MPGLLSGTCRNNIDRLRVAANGVSGDDGPRWCVTLNLEMVSRASRDADYENLLTAADWVTADGQPIAWWARRRHRVAHSLERTTGVDIVDSVLREPAWGSFAVIGGQDPAATVQRYNGATERCAFIADEKITSDSLDELARRINDRAPAVTLVALGVPKQDVICRALRDRGVATGLLVGVGGSFEILGPAGRRCPPWLARLGLEWLFRLAREPGRLWYRYLVQYPRGCRVLLAASRSSADAQGSTLLDRICRPELAGEGPPHA